MSQTGKVGSMYQRIYQVVRSIPAGKVTTYGQVAKLAGGCSARNVGYAMSSLPFNTDVPWQRVINVKGEISQRTDGNGDLIQRQILEGEGVTFNAKNQVDLVVFGY